MNSGVNGNLILNEGILQKGYKYHFQVDVTKYGTYGQIGFGSAMIIIDVLRGPVIYEEVLSVFPDCSNIEYDSIVDLLSDE